MTDTASGETSPIALWTRPQRVFLLLAIIFGHALVLTIPPFQSADEPVHLFRAYEITEGVLIHRQVDARGVAAGYLPASLYQIWLPFSHLGFHPERKASVGDVFNTLRIPLNPRQRMFITFANTAHYPPVCYLPQCVGIILGRMFRLPPLAMLYLGREFNLLFWIFLGYWAVRWAPVIARPLVLILLMPMSLYVACTLSADGPTNAIAAAYTAMILGIISMKGKAANLRQFLLLILFSIAICLCKLAYCPLLTLLLLIPASRFGGGLKYVAKLGVIIGICAATMLVWELNSSDADTRINLSSDVVPREQLQLLERHPSHFATLILESVHQRGWTYLQSYVGLIGWLDKYLPAGFVVAYLIVLFLACIPGEDATSLPSAGRVAAAVIPAVSVSFFMIALLSYLYWSPVGYPFIDGINGRYFIPISPAAALLVVSIMRRLGIGVHVRSQRLNLSTCILCLVSCGYFLFFVWNRYYG